MPHCTPSIIVGCKSCSHKKKHRYILNKRRYIKKCFCSNLQKKILKRVNCILENHNIKLIHRCISHWLNMGLDPQSLFGLLWTAVIIGWDPTTPSPPPLPPHLDSYTRAILVSQDRRLIFVTPWQTPHHQRTYIQVMIQLSGAWNYLFSWDFYYYLNLVL